MMKIETHQKYQQMKQALNEKQWRQYLALEAKEQGNITQVAKAAGVSKNTLKKGIREVESGDLYTPGSRLRKEGGGRKRISASDPRLIADLEALTDPKGDPMTYLRYTTKSLAHLEEALGKLGHCIKRSALAEVLHGLGYSLQPNKKTLEGESHPDRDRQFQHLNKRCQEFEQQGNPILSIDCKKKEPLGNFKNNGREWAKKGKEYETQVNVYDFASLAQGHANPYGIYDVLKKQGFVNVGIDHDRAAFAVESIRRWWKEYGSQLYPQATGLLLTADGGGSNGVRTRLFKVELQKLANELQLPITLCHYPPATSKWNVIEHQLFSFISINWRAKPLTSLAVILELISQTTTPSGLTVTAMADTNTYPTGIKVSDEELKQLNILRDSFHGDWNYTIKPQNMPPL
jgi:transposase